MAIRNRARPSRTSRLAINKFKGINISSTPSQLEKNRFAEALNVILDDKGAINKRYGYEEYIDKSTIAGKVNGIFDYVGPNGNEKLFIFGKELWSEVDEVLSGPYYTFQNELNVRGFNFDDKFYLINGEEYVEYNGTTASLVTDVAYVPTTIINAPPAGGGTPFEETNLLTPTFKQTWVADGAATTYQFDGLDELGNPIPLDSEEVIVTINLSTVLTEGVDFTVNRTNATIDFSAGSSPYGAPLNEDLVEAQAARTEAGNADKINKMKIFHIFGGENDTRVFLSGNTDIPNVDYRSGINDATYFPVNNFDILGDRSDPILGYATQLSAQVVFKREEIYVGFLNIEQDTGLFAFIRKPVTDNVDFRSTDSLQIIDNSPMFVTSKGVYEYIGGTGVRDERNVKHLSEKIDKNVKNIGILGILQEGNLSEYIGVDYDEKYILINTVLETAWVYDYRYKTNNIGEWFKWDNMPFSSAQVIDTELYLGHKSTNKIYKVNKNSKNDDGAAINSYVDTKVFTFDTYMNLKLIKKIFYTLKSDIRTSAKLLIRSDITGTEYIEFRDAAASLFSYGDTFTYGNEFTYGANIFPIEVREKVWLKKVNFLQIRLQNNVVDESMGIPAIGFSYSYDREVK